MSAVEVVLEGILGKKFGAKWSLHVSSPSEALRIIDINSPGLTNWIRDNANVYEKYRVECEYENGSKELLSEETYLAERGNLKRITFSVAIDGAGGKNGVVQFVVGAVLVVAGIIVTGMSFGTAAPVGGAMISVGIGMMVGGVIQMLTPQPKLDSDQDGGGRGRKASSYFDSPGNTTRQGNPVPLCYGRILAGSQVVSADLSIEQTL